MKPRLERESLLASLAAYLTSDPAAASRFLAWLESRFAAIEPNVRAFLPEAGRFDRLRGDLERLAFEGDDSEHRPLIYGMPFAVKDIFHVEGFTTRAGSQLPVDALQGEQAVSVGRLRRAGGLILGKTVTTEFAYFAPGPTTNPRRADHTPGGSSSGSAAAVAAGLAPLALGTQTIGSINRPAAFCGAVGFKPSVGRIPTAGVIPLSPSLDHVGYFTPDAGSAAWVAPLLVDDWVDVPVGLTLSRLGIPTGPYLDHAEPEGRHQFEKVAAQLQAAGYAVVEVECMPDFEDIVARHQLILAAEAARVHAQWFSSFPERYHQKTRALIEAGQLTSDLELEQARAGRLALRAALQGAMDEHGLDAWIAPSAPGPAPHGLESTGDPVLNLPWTHAGMPTISIPSGVNDVGLPFGLQVIARFGQDAPLLEWGQMLEMALDFQAIHGLDDFLGDIA